MKNLMETDFTQHEVLRSQLGKVIKHKAGATTSDRYVAVNTMDVIDDLHAKGFLMTELSGAYSKKVNHKDGKHRVVMINPEVKIGSLAKNDPTYARVIVSNSYNARAALKIIAGMFRSACENGMVFGQIGDISKLSNKHVSGVLEGLDQVHTYIDKLPQMSKLIDVYRETEISDEMLNDMALNLAMTRQEVIWGSKFDPTGFQVDYESMTEVWREEDEKRDAWTVFNLLQEKVIKGGYDYRPFADSNVRMAKAIRNPYTQDKINEKLFTTFQEVLVA